MFTIDLLFDSSVVNSPEGSQIEAAATAAAAALAGDFSNNVTLDLHVGLGEIEGQTLGHNDLGESDEDSQSYSFTQVSSILAGIPEAPTPSSIGFTPGMTVDLTMPEAAALGLAPSVQEGWVGFSSKPGTFFFGAPQFDEVDFAGIFDHEVSEVMGRISDIGYSQGYTLLDRYRFAAESDLVHDGATPAYFSPNGGLTVGNSFNTDSTADPGDWSGVQAADSFDAFGDTGLRSPVSAGDFTVMEGLGWTPTNVVPPDPIDYTAAIDAAYQAWFGRAPQPGEIATWNGLLNTTDTVAQMRAILLASPEGQGHTTAEVTALYDTYMGRDPTSAELGVWQGLVASGDDFATVRSTLVASPEGQGHTNAEVTALYDTYMGRGPTPSELGVWQGLIAGSDDFTAVRCAILASAEGQAHTTAAVTGLYDAYMGRDPTSAELGVWSGLIVGGDDFTAVRSAILGSPEGAAHTSSQVTLAY
ncbi:MAG: NF038122 family metalloprotease, partial [Caulobacteraceae bacterium]|nr:NF038122 family metalloprotease [Caulobacteraceae bacterium]